MKLKDYLLKGIRWVFNILFFFVLGFGLLFLGAILGAHESKQMQPFQAKIAQKIIASKCLESEKFSQNFIQFMKLTADNSEIVSAPEYKSLTESCDALKVFEEHRANAKLSAEKRSSREAKFFTITLIFMGAIIIIGSGALYFDYRERKLKKSNNEQFRS